MDSAPPAKAGALSSDPRYLAEQQRLDMMVKHAPQIAAIHYEDADSPTECQYAMSLSFCAQIYESTASIPGSKSLAVAGVVDSTGVIELVGFLEVTVISLSIRLFR